jgi:glycosyltransferase involved in cell wall biosynthesis
VLRCRRSVLFVGRFDRHKGGDLAIDAFRAVADVLPEARLVFVGPDRGLQSSDGRSRRTLSSYLDEELPPAVRGRVQVMGALAADAIEPLRRRALVTIVPSRYETFGIALAEALAFGCPTIGARAGAIPEILAEERTGLLFEAGDAAGLAARIVALFGNRDRAAELGHAAAEDVAARLSPDAVARATIDYYDGVLARRRPSRLAQARRAPWRALYAATGVY